MFAATRRALFAALFALLLAAAAAAPPASAAAASRAIVLDAVAGAMADDRLLAGESNGVAERRRLVQYASAQAAQSGGAGSVEDLLLSRSEETSF